MLDYAPPALLFSITLLTDDVMVRVTSGSLCAIWIFWRFKRNPANLQSELTLLRQRRWHIVVPAAILLYGITFVARNLAYHRNQLTEGMGLLPDLGFELLPELPARMAGVSHWLTLLTAGIAIGVATLALRQINHQVFLVNIVIRAAHVLTIGHVLRALFYLSTTLPAPAFHCQLNDPSYLPPSNLYEILFRFSPHGCGDLFFSGHILTTTVLTLTTQRYAAKLLGPSWSLFVRSASWSAYLALGPLIIMARNHYTVDVLGSYVISPALWLAYEAHFPEDPQPIE